MTKETLERVYTFLQSRDSEMKDLAVTIFCAGTKHYQSYWDLLNIYHRNGVMVPPADLHLNKMFNHIDNRTVINVLKSEISKVDFKVGRHRDILKNCKIIKRKEK